MNIQKQIQGYYDQWSNIYDTNENKTRDLEKKVLQESLGKKYYKNILEAGCGTGKNTGFLSEICEELLSVDFSEKMLEKAIIKHKSSKIHFQQLDLISPWSWQPETFDMVVFSLVLEHVENLNEIFEKTSTVLGEGGTLYICELHPFRQYLGTKARFESEHGRIELPAFIHPISEFIECGLRNGFILEECGEYSETPEDKTIPPRLLKLIFRK